VPTTTLVCATNAKGNIFLAIQSTSVVIFIKIISNAHEIKTPLHLYYISKKGLLMWYRIDTARARSLIESSGHVWVELVLTTSLACKQWIIIFDSNRLTFTCYFFLYYISISTYRSNLVPYNSFHWKKWPHNVHTVSPLHRKRIDALGRDLEDMGGGK